MARMTREELLRRYAAGERDFTGVDLTNLYLREAELPGINLRGAILEGTDFSGAVLKAACLAGCRLGAPSPSQQDSAVSFGLHAVAGFVCIMLPACIMGILSLHNVPTGFSLVAGLLILGFLVVLLWRGVSAAAIGVVVAFVTTVALIAVVAAFALDVIPMIHYHGNLFPEKSFSYQGPLYVQIFKLAFIFATAFIAALLLAGSCRARYYGRRRIWRRLDLQQTCRFRGMARSNCDRTDGNR